MITAGGIAISNPASALPTDPYTVIHVTWKYASPVDYSAGILMLNGDRMWEYEPGVVYEGDDLIGDIVSFEVLSEPRRVECVMSSERVDGLNRDWPGRADVFRSYGGELDQDMVDQLDRAHTPSERAGSPAYGALDRERARAWLIAQFGLPNLPDEISDGELDALEACVVPDPRARVREQDVIDALYREEQARDAMEAKLARIETEVYGTEKPQNLEAALFMRERVRAILRGDQ